MAFLEFFEHSCLFAKSIEKSKLLDRYILWQDLFLLRRLARKQAFVEISNLMASFQRMIQEPKSKQNKLPQVQVNRS
jgi:hypothetical protein